MFLLWALLLPLGGATASASEDETDDPDEIRVRIYKKPMAPAPFNLSDHNGQPFTADSLKNHWSIVFFGYTSCADICPTTLAAINIVAKKLSRDPLNDGMRMVFVSVDPHRDTLDRIKEHVAFFNPAFSGVTGRLEELQQFAFSLGAFFDYRDRDTRKIIKNIAELPHDDDYIVGHAADLLIFNPDGLLAGVVFPPHEPDHILAAFERVRSSGAVK